MPTTGPRIQVALDETTYDVIRRLSKASRLSMSRICADVIDQAAPVMARSTKMLEAAAALSEEARDQLRRDIAKEEKVARRAYGQAFAALAATEAAIHAAKEGPGGLPRAGGPRPASTTRKPKTRRRTPGQ